MRGFAPISFFTEIFGSLRNTSYLCIRNDINKKMETRKFKQVPSINRVGERNPRIPKPVIVNYGNTNQEKENKVIRLIKDTIRQQEPNADIILFGSRARGEARKDSD